MKTIMIQFHSTVEELLEFVEVVETDFDLSVTVMIMKPFSLKEFNRELDMGALRGAIETSDVNLILTNGKASLGASTQNQFLDLNPGSIVINIGKLSSGVLHESGLAFMSDDELKIKIANKVAAKLKKITNAGAIAVNPVTGAEAKIRSHRYTEGAKAKYEEGVKIVPIAGNNIFKLLD